MKEINDNEFNTLIKDTFERREVLEDIHRQVMMTVKKRKRHAEFCRWARLLAFCFGFPLLVMFMLYSAYKIIVSNSSSQTVIVSMAFFIATIIVFAYKAIGEFSFE